MSATIWWTIAGCTVVTAVIKAIGPVALGGRDLPPRLTGVILWRRGPLLLAVATAVAVTALLRAVA